jgi:DNA repair exonuclease SbcCD nuclease subunit
MKFLHFADLHLSRADRDYSFSVLEELAGLAAERRCDVVFIAGDLFDSHGDAEALRGDFRIVMNRLPGSCGVYYLPGNHEELGAPAGAGLDRWDFGRTRLFSSQPFSLVPLSDEAELLALPFRASYSDYREWKVPEKKASLRILLAHGTVPGIVYTGPDEDAAGGVLDRDLFSHLKIDYAALGHIHGGSVNRIGTTLVCYPGSARVWREGETGPRGALVVETGPGVGAVKPETVVLKRAGRFRGVSVPVTAEGHLDFSRETLREAAPEDWVRLEASGVVEEEKSVGEALRNLARDLEGACRRVTIDTGELEVLAGVSTHPLALRFVQAWEAMAARYDNPDDAMVYRLARQRGLLALKEMIEGKK